MLSLHYISIFMAWCLTLNILESLISPVTEKKWVDSEMFDIRPRNICKLKDVAFKFKGIVYTYTSVDCRKVRQWSCSEKSPSNVGTWVITDKHGIINPVGTPYMGVHAALYATPGIFQFISVVSHWEFQVCYELNSFPPKRYVEILIPSTSSCNLLWKEACGRCNSLGWDTRVGQTSNPVWLLFL